MLNFKASIQVKRHKILVLGMWKFHIKVMFPYAMVVKKHHCNIEIKNWRKMQFMLVGK